MQKGVLSILKQKVPLQPCSRSGRINQPWVLQSSLILTPPFVALKPRLLDKDAMNSSKQQLAIASGCNINNVMALFNNGFWYVPGRQTSPDTVIGNATCTHAHASRDTCTKTTRALISSFAFLKRKSCCNSDTNEACLLTLAHAAHQDWILISLQRICTCCAT